MHALALGRQEIPCETLIARPVLENLAVGLSGGRNSNHALPIGSGISGVTSKAVPVVFTVGFAEGVHWLALTTAHVESVRALHTVITIELLAVGIPEENLTVSIACVQVVSWVAAGAEPIGQVACLA